MEIRTAELIYKYLTGALSDPEKRELDGWLAADARHVRLLDELRDGREWRDREKFISGIDMARAMRRFEARLKPRRRLKILRYAAAIAAVTAVAGLLVWRIDLPRDHISEDIMPGSPKASLYTGGRPIALVDGEERRIAVSPSQNVYYNGEGITYDADSGNDGEAQTDSLVVPRGGEFAVVLSDGSRVWVNSATKLEYPSTFGDDAREVTLTGEAFFEVEKDGRPFRVLTRYAKIEVSGTSFGVSCYPEQSGTAAVLETGSILFSAGDETVELAPGERAATLGTGGIEVGQVDVRYHTAWRHGNFYFDDQPLSEIMTILSRWYDVDFVFADRSLEEIRFSGVALRSKPCDYVLRMLAQTNTVRFVQRDGNTIAVEKT